MPVDKWITAVGMCTAKAKAHYFRSPCTLLCIDWNDKPLINMVSSELQSQQRGSLDTWQGQFWFILFRIYDQWKVNRHGNMAVTQRGSSRGGNIVSGQLAVLIWDKWQTFSVQRLSVFMKERNLAHVWHTFKVPHINFFLAKWSLS